MPELNDSEFFDAIKISLKLKEEVGSAEARRLIKSILVGDSWEAYSQMRLWSLETKAENKEKIIKKILKGASSVLKYEELVIPVPDDPEKSAPAILYPNQFYAALRREIGSRGTLADFATLLESLDKKKKGLGQTYLYRLLEKNPKKIRKLKKENLILILKALKKMGVRELKLKINRKDFDETFE